MRNATASSLVSELIDFVKRQGYRPGDRLPTIRQLSATLDLGRNAIRDGLLEAQTLGFVRIEPRLGVFVQDLDPANGTDRLTPALEKTLSQDQNLFHVVDARLLVETELVAEVARTRRAEDLLPLRQALETVLGVHGDRLAFIKADEAFHLAIARMAANRVLFAFLRTLWQMLVPAKLNLPLSSDNRQVSDREHQELFQSIVAGDAERARAVMRAHVEQGRALLLQYVHTLPHPECASENTSLMPTTPRKRTGGKAP